jgi:glycosyltransferase involved in cell wall biosynthesis
VSRAIEEISLIATVYNDVNGTRLFLKRMEEQTKRPDEMVVCDAGSKDGTWELLLEYQERGAIPLVALQELRCRPARGRNLAVSVARHDILAVTDIGCDWDPQWLDELVAPFKSTAPPEAVMGSWKVRWDDQQTPWAKADYALQNGLELRATPQSHSANRAIAYRKDFYCRAGGLPEDLTFAADDMVLALLIQILGRSLDAAPEPRCYWFRPQSLRGLLRESYRNFRGSGEAGIWLKDFFLVGGRLVVELLAISGLAVSPLLGFSYGTIAAGGLVTILASLRVARWLRVVRRFSKAGFHVSFLHLAVLDYLSRWYAIGGYLRGLLHGFAHCQACRSRVRVAGIGWV